MKTNSNLIIPAVVASVLLLIAPLGSWPYGYYQLLRLVVCAVSAWFAYYSFRQKTIWRWFFSLSCLMFNPLFPVTLSKELWAVIDVINGLAMLAFAFVPSRAFALLATKKRIKKEGLIIVVLALVCLLLGFAGTYFRSLHAERYQYGYIDSDRIIKAAGFGVKNAEDNYPDFDEKNYAKRNMIRNIEIIRAIMEELFPELRQKNNLELITIVRGLLIAQRGNGFDWATAKPEEEVSDTDKQFVKQLNDMKQKLNIRLDKYLNASQLFSGDVAYEILKNDYQEYLVEESKYNLISNYDSPYQYEITTYGTYRPLNAVPSLENLKKMAKEAAQRIADWSEKIKQRNWNQDSPAYRRSGSLESLRESVEGISIQLKAKKILVLYDKAVTKDYFVGDKISNYLSQLEKYKKDYLDEMQSKDVRIEPLDSGLNSFDWSENKVLSKAIRQLESENEREALKREIVSTAKVNVTNYELNKHASAEDQSNEQISSAIYYLILFVIGCYLIVQLIRFILWIPKSGA